MLGAFGGMYATGEAVNALVANIYGKWEEEGWLPERISKAMDEKTFMEKATATIGAVMEPLLEASMFGLVMDLSSATMGGTWRLYSSLPGPTVARGMAFLEGLTKIATKGDFKGALKSWSILAPGGTVLRQWVRKKKKKGYRL